MDFVQSQPTGVVSGFIPGMEAPNFVFVAPQQQEVTEKVSLVAENPTTKYEQTTEVIRTLLETVHESYWTIGDLMIEMTEGMKPREATVIVKRIAQDCRESESTLLQYRWVSGKFPPGPVREISPVLSYTHYRAVANCDNAEELLNKAATECWTVAQLQREASIGKAAMAGVPTPTSCERPGCGVPLSTDSTDQVHAVLYGEKYAYCSAACLMNSVLNDLHTMRNQALKLEAHEYRAGTVGILPFEKADQESEDKVAGWPARRHLYETQYYRRPTGMAN